MAQFELYVHVHIVDSGTVCLDKKNHRINRSNPIAASLLAACQLFVCQAGKCPDQFPELATNALTEIIFYPLVFSAQKILLSGVESREIHWGRGPDFAAPCSQEIEKSVLAGGFLRLVEMPAVIGVTSLGQDMRDNGSSDPASDAAADKRGKHIAHRIPFYWHVCIGIIGGMMAGPIGAFIYFAFIEKFLARQSLLRASKRDRKRQLLLQA